MSHLQQRIQPALGAHANPLLPASLEKDAQQLLEYWLFLSKSAYKRQRHKRRSGLDNSRCSERTDRLPRHRCRRHRCWFDRMLNCAQAQLDTWLYCHRRIGQRRSHWDIRRTRHSDSRYIRQRLAAVVMTPICFVMPVWLPLFAPWFVLPSASGRQANSSYETSTHRKPGLQPCPSLVQSDDGSSEHAKALTISELMSNARIDIWQFIISLLSSLSLKNAGQPNWVTVCV